MISFFVAGDPAPKGSMRAFMRAGRAFVVASGSKANAKALRAWDRAVRDKLVAAIGARSTPVFTGMPLEVHLVFRLERPESHYGTGKNRDQLKPSSPELPATQQDDVDKLARAVLDSLTANDDRGGLFDDDGRIAILIAQKEYAEARGGAGVMVTARVLAPSERRGVVQAQGVITWGARGADACTRSP